MSERSVLKLVILEDNEIDAELIQRALKKDNVDFEVTHYQSYKEFIHNLPNLNADAIISDFNLPNGTAIDAFKETRAHNKELPFIVVSGFIGDEKAVETLKLGVTDLVSKNNLERLPFALRRAMEEYTMRMEKQQAEQDLKLSKERLELAIYGGDLGTWDLDYTRKTISYSERGLRILGIENPVSTLEFNYFLPHEADKSNERERIINAFNRFIEGQDSIFEYELSFDMPSGELRWVLINGKIIARDENDIPTRLSGTIRNITRRKQDEIEISRTKAILEEAEKLGVIGSFDWNVRNDSFISSKGFQNILALNEINLNYEDYLQHIHPADRRIFEEVLLRKSRRYTVEHRVVLSNGKVKTIKSSGKVLYNDDENQTIQHIFGVIQDISEERSLKESLFKSQDMERKRIAREIHDGIGQMLIATKYRLSSVLDKPEPREGIKEIEELMDLIIQESRKITKSLYSVLIEESGPNKAIAFLIEDIKNATGITINAYIDDLKTISLDLGNTLYRITQEALNNIIKYAEASSVEIHITHRREFIKLKISDDGKGIDRATLKSNSGNGLKNMKERAMLLNGIFDIKSEEGVGTIIQCMFPLSRKQE